jgi:hypothetical protein
MKNFIKIPNNERNPAMDITKKNDKRKRKKKIALSTKRWNNSVRQKFCPVCEKNTIWEFDKILHHSICKKCGRRDLSYVVNLFKGETK